MCSSDFGIITPGQSRFWALISGNVVERQPANSQLPNCLVVWQNGLMGYFQLFPLLFELLQHEQLGSDVALGFPEQALLREGKVPLNHRAVARPFQAVITEQRLPSLWILVNLKLIGH